MFQDFTKSSSILLTLELDNTLFNQGSNLVDDPQ